MSNYKNYSESLVRQLWDYVESSPVDFADALDRDGYEEGRPPVLLKTSRDKNVLVRPDADEAEADEIATMLPQKERHRWFGSMKSSQALAQSVFGNLMYHRKLGLLSDITSDQGLPAFCRHALVATTELEHLVENLGEQAPRQTSVDFWLDGDYRIAIECKLTEQDFGTCSRPKLKSGKDNNYDSDFCDGSYTFQQARSSRCSLTEQEIKYWKYVPELFGWPSDRDMEACPLRYSYQLVRNILAACVSDDGSVIIENRHALTIYDARNPTFLEGGAAKRQWDQTAEALRFPELLRSVSWQKIVAALSEDAELTWLTDALATKYGI